MSGLTGVRRSMALGPTNARHDHPCYGQRMGGDPQRCETHGVVLTATGACLLCERRGGVRPATSGSTMTWLVLGVVGALLASAIGVRAYRALSDRRAADAAARAEAAVVAPGTRPPATEPRSGNDGEPTDSSGEHQLRVAEAEHSVQIDFYGAGWCPACRDARAWLDAEKIRYSYRDIDGDAANKRAMRALNPRGSIPTIDIEGRHIVGFDPRAMRDAIRGAAEARVAQAGR